MEEKTEIAEEKPPIQEAQLQTEEKQDEHLEKPKKDADHNWQQVREVIQLQKQRIEDLEGRLSQKVEPPKQEEPDEFANLDPEDYLTVGKARSMAEKLAEKKAVQVSRQVVQEYMQQHQVTLDEQRMRSKHEDYDYVVENFAVPLIKNDPALAYKIQQSKNPAETAYKLGKISDSYEESNMKQPTSPKAEKILKNSSRPVSSNAVGSPLKNQADSFSNLSKQQVWEMAEKYAKGA
jgi:hypothetical protein